jgi:AcrR family transcriptional regulator
MVLRPSLEKKEEKERVRSALLEAALQLAAAHGFGSLGLREVSREAGIAPTSFYRHFADMEELGEALIRERVGAVLRGVGERVLAVAKSEVVPTVIDALLAAVARDRPLWRFILEERVGASPAFRALLRSELATLAHTVSAALTGARSDPQVLPPMAASAAVGLLFDGCGNALDEPLAKQNPVRELLLWSLGRLLDAPSSRPT